MALNNNQKWVIFKLINLVGGFFYCYELNANLFGLTDLQGGSNTLPFIHLTNNNKPHCVAFFFFGKFRERRYQKISISWRKFFYCYPTALYLPKGNCWNHEKKKRSKSHISKLTNYNTLWTFIKIKSELNITYCINQKTKINNVC